MNYYVIPDGRDDCPLPTTPEPMSLDELGQHLATLLGMLQRQGYYSNCRQERIPLDQLEFRLVPDDNLTN